MLGKSWRLAVEGSEEVRSQQPDVRRYQGIQDIFAFWLLASDSWLLSRLFLAEDDPALGQVIGRKRDLHPVARQDADKMLAHLPGDDPQNFALRVVKPQLEHG